MQDITQSFIVRIWWEEGHPDEEAQLGSGALFLRGSVEHVGSRKRIHFQELDGILDFIQECVEKPNLGPGNRAQHERR